LDISSEMTSQARESLNRLLVSPVEEIPLEQETIDIAVCRQGLQFVNIEKAMAEIHRVLRPGGKVVFSHLCAYGLDDRADAFKVQALRNSARINFFLPGDLEAALEKGGFEVKESKEYQSCESVNQWINHGASTEEERQQIRQCYQDSSLDFKRLHNIRFEDDDIFDTMLFVTVVAEKKALHA
ncbi:MAG: class I SAM-dependent methyltransferase, partial [Bdellovibrionales bacterium]|nr:class I SAM-dependent methyltransferase [Bdellovibrionales bacterium]